MHDHGCSTVLCAESADGIIFQTCDVIDDRKTVLQRIGDDFGSIAVDTASRAIEA